MDSLLSVVVDGKLENEIEFGSQFFYRYFHVARMNISSEMEITHFVSDKAIYKISSFSPIWWGI